VPGQLGLLESFVVHCKVGVSISHFNISISPSSR